MKMGFMGLLLRLVNCHSGYFNDLLLLRSFKDYAYHRFVSRPVKLKFMALKYPDFPKEPRLRVGQLPRVGLPLYP